MKVDFGCNPCSHRFSVSYPDRQAYIDSTRPQCPKCESANTRRVIDLRPADMSGLQAVKSKFDAMYPRADNTLPLRMSGAKCVTAGDAFHRSGAAIGTPIIEDKRHERNIMAQRGLVRV